MNLFRFEHPDVLYLLLLNVAIIAIFILLEISRKKKLCKIGKEITVSKLLHGESTILRRLKYVLFILGFSSLIVALANPQEGSKVETIERKGVDLMIALDISNSMLAEDIKPSRLERAKQAISLLLDNMKNDRIGLTVFAGKAYLQLPLTMDYNSVKMLLSTVDPTFIPVQGTALAEAIKLSVKSFNESDHSKAVIIITDGENHIGDAVSEAKAAKENGITVHTIGIGTPDGTPIPIIQNGRTIGYRKDKNGATVVTKLDEESLKQIAEAGGGAYIRANSARVGLKKIFDDINAMDTTVFETQKVTDYKDGFQYFVALAILFFFLIIVLPDKSNGKLRLDNILKKESK
ncbi:MAG: VWA domain-containing protein [Bacteroidales bacterium]|jgi:Ca-activated chloride channel homolog|nr:VWA domain-containing protein [Bacteroidales bacterium]MDD2203867.1 VWA domain-containing protein [Bacteroidales bacterium]MDD3151376.1 VWA domain-containing protein [Bacteroidales bacterium]MDD3913117.1 VWA domain-containing protein [Bacteroidales bacterium]MDD4633032.1 VWA domain-containing protein [Bacteroidales bacterium]